MKRCFLFTISIIVILAGCANQRIIDQVQIIQVLGYDKHEDKVKGTVIFPTYEEQGKTDLHVLDTEAASFENIVPRLNTKSTYPIDVGQLRTVLFGKDFAEQGIDPVIHFLSRDPKVGSRMQLGISEDTAEGIIRSIVKEKVPYHINYKIDQNIQYGSLPKMNLHVFLTNFYSEGMDPFLPYFTIEGNTVKIDGLALFNKGKYVNHINMTQSFLCKMLMDGTQNGRYETKIKGNEKEGFISLKSLDSKAKYTINQKDRIPHISIDLTMKAQLKKGLPGLNYTKNKDIEKTEKILDEHFNKEVQQLISLFQEYNLDPLGLGDKVRAKSRSWDYGRFQDMYPHLKTTVNTKVTIIQTGVEE
ncbi:Ger(x)C family spore germination protein [Peribacillus cavernae]|uniref:Ger(X)C family spore germination protein n=1 Tax=Peribacillus cavernae TaxID=1674310 RepID=A0A3S0UG78_9BACI|nr:Ger(x)C family spore germination protein [Peribacillus cavernae]MDQ0218698.1 Ger(x)C family germination protein [Peribacillus cavernae]RUQ30916.1 Ger(x)C family spore germination protein [Peribacillus cavernae]